MKIYFSLITIALLLSYSSTDAQQISAGGEHSIFLCADNYVHGWGRNDLAQMGDSSLVNKTTPTKTLGGHRFIQVATGLEHSYALKSDGQVYGWGRAAEGQLGWWFAGPIHYYRQAPTVWRNTSGIDAVKLADTRGHFSMAMRDDSTLYAWGENIFGQLGDSTTSNRENYVAITSAGKITDLVGGFDHALVLKPDSTMMSTGYNKVGQLGNGSTAPRTTYGVVDSVDQVIAIEAGAYFSVALKADGTVWTWGINGRGQMGDGTTNNRFYPRQVPGLTNVTAIAAGKQHVLALKSDSTVVAWGGNDYGQIGDSSLQNRQTPVAVKRLTGVMVIEAGGYHSTAITSNNAVISWGRANSGQIGNCDSSQNYLTFDTTQLKCMYCPEIVTKPFGTSGQFYDISFTDSSSSSCSYLWDFGDGNTSFDQNPTHSYSKPGVFNVCQYLENSCSSDTICDSIIVVCPMPVSSFGHSGNSTTISFSDSSSYVTDGWVWSFGDGNQDTVQNPTNTYSSAGSYNVCLITKNDCGSDTLCMYINVHCILPIPGFTFAVNGLDVQFTDASDSASSVSWDFDDGKSDTSFSPLHTYDSSGVYNVCQTVYSDCADSTHCEEVNVASTGIEIEEYSGIRIYPNPVKDQLNIENLERVLSIIIYNSAGQKVLKLGEMDSGLNQIDVSKLDRGTYMVKVEAESHMTFQKILILK